MALGNGLQKMIPTDGASVEKKTVTKSKKSSTSKPNVASSSKKSKVEKKEVVKEVIKEVPAERFVKLSDIEPNLSQPRKDFNEGKAIQNKQRGSSDRGFRLSDFPA